LLEAPANRRHPAARSAGGIGASHSRQGPGRGSSYPAVASTRAALVGAAAALWVASTRLRRIVGERAGGRRRQRPAPSVVLAFILVAGWLANGAASAPGDARSAPGDASSASSVGAAPVAAAARPVVGSSDARTAGKLSADAQRAATAAPLATGPFLADGTLMKPLLVDSVVPGAMRFAVTIYTVRSGDTLTGIASRFGVSMMTLWWANTLSSKDVLRVGQRLRIPPVSGLLYTVGEGDTLDSIAAFTHADVRAIREFNGLTSDTVVIGQLLMIPDGVGAPIPTPAPTPAPTARPAAVAPSASVQPLATMSGVASWMYSSGTAARLAVGTLLNICGDGGCILRRVTSWGPSNLDRIVDLSAEDFEVVCGCGLWVGLTVVRIDILPG